MWFENPFRSNDPDNLALLLRNLGLKQVRFVTQENILKDKPASGFKTLASQRNHVPWRLIKLSCPLMALLRRS